MDPNYNIIEGKALLEHVYQTASNDLTDSLPVKAFDENRHALIFVEQPRSWRIIGKDEENSNEEQTFYMYGILCKSDLPPIRMSLDKANTMRHKARYLRQSVRLTGLGAPSFEEDVEGLRKIHSTMKLSLENNEHEVIPWQAEMYEGHSAIDLNARYFTPRRFVPTEMGLPFDIGVDPNGVLSTMRGADLIHGMDNKVDYLQEIMNKEGRAELKRIEPKEFSTGAIVRISMSLVAFMNKDNSVRTSTMLKAITLIKKNIKHEHAPIPRVAVIKRKRTFDEESNTRRVLESMNIGK